MDAKERLDLLYESLDNDILDPLAYSDEEIEEDLKKAGVDIEASTKRFLQLVEELLRKR